MRFVENTAAAVLAAAKDMLRRGLVEGTAGNISVRLDDGGWLAFRRTEADGADTAAVEIDPMPEQEAWDAAFEVYRNQVII